MDQGTVYGFADEMGDVAKGERAALKYSALENPLGVKNRDKQSPYGRQLLQGQEVEKEHKGTIGWLKKNPDATLTQAARSIASEHLEADDKYYTHLKEMEGKYKRAMWAGFFDEFEQIKEAGIFSRAGEAIQRKVKDLAPRLREKGKHTLQDIAEWAKDRVRPGIYA